MALSSATNDRVMIGRIFASFVPGRDGNYFCFHTGSWCDSAGRLEPARHRHLLLRVELDAFDALDVQVAEEATCSSR